MIVMTFGEVTWGVQELALHQEVATPAVADIGYLAFYPIVLFGLFSMPQAPVSGIRRLKLGLDIAIGVGALALVSSHFVIAAILRDGTGSWQSQAISVTYPIGDVALVFATVVLAARGRNHASVGMMVLAAGFLSIAVSDSLYTYLTQVGDYYSGSLIDSGWVLGYSLIAMAGLLTSSRRLDIDAYKVDADQPVPFWQTLALQIAIVPVGLTLFTDISGGTASVDVMMLAGFVVLGVLASVRQGITHLENTRLNRQLEQMTLDLQGRIQTTRMHTLLGVTPDADERPADEPAGPAVVETACEPEPTPDPTPEPVPVAEAQLGPEPAPEFVRPEFGESSSRLDDDRYRPPGYGPSSHSK
jgi:hypothetical protein